jgi:hypothetical protein
MFLFFALMAVCAVWFVRGALVETKGKSLEQIETQVLHPETAAEQPAAR